MDATESALLAAVLAAPADDLPRLVYADWLDENAGTVPCPGRCLEGWLPRTDGRLGADQCRICRGSGTVSNGKRERAEFIRTQCELTRLRCRRPDSCGEPGSLVCRNCVRAIALRRRERELLAVRGDEWFTPGPGWGASLRSAPELSIPHAIVRRGFADALRGPLAAFWGERECGACLHPDVRVSLTMAGVDPTCDACSGSGRVSGPTPGLVAVVRREPVVRVEVTDRKPYRAERSSWYDTDRPDGDPENHPESDLPTSLFDALRGHTHTYDGAKFWPAKATARDALSAAILSAARP